MEKEVYKPKEGFEDIYELLKQHIDNLVDTKEAEIKAAVEQIERKYEERLVAYNTELQNITTMEIVTVEEEKEESIEEEKEEELKQCPYPIEMETELE